MMRLLPICLIFVVASIMAPLNAANTYDLIFRTGTLDDVPKTAVLQYDRAVMVRDDPEMSAQNTGLIRLSFEADDMARLRYQQGDKHRDIGSFPATVGNPIIMYFVETVVRDVAKNAGGSPFYIRNRVKESLSQFAEIVDASADFGDDDVAVQQVTLRPFLNDPNRSKMKGYEDLSITVTMSDDVPGWYYSLAAQAGSVGGNALLYRNALTLVAKDLVQ